MPRSIRLAVLSATAAALIAVVPASAGAASTAPTSLDFGGVPVGSASAPQPVMLTQACTTFIGDPVNVCGSVALDTFTVNVSASGDFSATSGCPMSFVPITTTSVSCTINVTFTPTAEGTRTGTLSTGTGVGLTPGPTTSLTGAGVAPGGGGGGGAATGTSTSPTGTTGGPGSTGTTTKHKKCKKRRHAAAVAKKCKKRR